MFNTLETTWERPSRRGWTALASFTLQVMALSLLVLVPLFSIQGPPRWEWLRPLVAPPAPSPAPPVQVEHHATSAFSNMVGDHIQIPIAIPKHANQIVDNGPITPPEIPGGVLGSTGPNVASVVPGGTGTAVPILMPKVPNIPTRPPNVSKWAEGNLVHKVQPEYPPIARAAGIQGTVLLRAIISKTGTIESLNVVSGHPMLVRSAIEAVKQWRYRPYMLNGEPIEVETEVTVNFILSRG